jgi:hypothetical protein
MPSFPFPPLFTQLLSVLFFRHWNHIGIIPVRRWFSQRFGPSIFLSFLYFSDLLSSSFCRRFGCAVILVVVGFCVPIQVSALLPTTDRYTSI